MNLEQTISEARASRRKKPAKVIAKQTELGFAQEPFRLVGQTMPAPVAPDRAAVLFCELRRTVENISDHDTPPLL